MRPTRTLLLLVSLATASLSSATTPRLTLPLAPDTDDVAGRPAVVTALALSADGTRLAAGGDDHGLRVWDAATGEPLHRLAGHDGWVRAARFTAAGTLASVAADHSLCLWDLTPGEPATQPSTRKLAAGPLLAVAWRPDGHRLAIAGFGDAVRVYDLQTPGAGDEPTELGCPCEDTRAVAFSPDGRWLAAAGRNGVVRLWDLVASGGPRDLPSDGRRVRALAFSPDGQTLAAGGDGPAVRLWRLDSRAVRFGDESATPTELLIRPGKAHALAFVDDTLLAVGGTRDTIRVWDTTAASPRLELRGHTGTVAALAASADGRRLASGSFDTTVRVWDLDPAAIHANRTAARDATATR